jgi:hypothetical protein
MRKTLLALVFLALCPILLAQQGLNNDAVIKLVKAGLSDELIVSTINAEAGTYDASTDGLIALKGAGVSDKVVSAIVAKASAPTPVAAPAPPASDSATPPDAATDDQDDPAAPHDPGVYLLTTTPDGKSKMAFIDRASIASTKTSNLMGAAFSYGIAKAKVKVELTGAKAPVRTTGEKSVFYMYFPPSINLGGLGGTDIITSPSQFTLLLLDEKKDHRESTVARIGLGGADTGNDEKRTNQFISVRVRSGVYKVAPTQDLKPGEYAFVATTTVSGTTNGETYIVYDFGVDAR